MLESLSGLNCIYFAMLGVGVVYALTILVAGEVHDMGMHVEIPHDVGFDPLHGSVGLVSLSPITIAGFLTAFGAFGLISLGLFEATGPQSLIWASLGGLTVGVLSHIAFIYVFVKPQGSSEVRLAELEGLAAEVVTSIPGGKVGEIAFVAQGGRMTMTARSADGGAIARGTVVRIEDVLGSVALVRVASPPPASEDPAPAAGDNDGG